MFFKGLLKTFQKKMKDLEGGMEARFFAQLGQRQDLGSEGSSME